MEGLGGDGQIIDINEVFTRLDLGIRWLTKNSSGKWVSKWL